MSKKFITLFFLVFISTKNESRGIEIVFGDVDGHGCGPPTVLLPGTDCENCGIVLTVTPPSLNCSGVGPNLTLIHKRHNISERVLIAGLKLRYSSFHFTVA